MKDCDIAIFGAGIAGASLAWRLAGQRSVVLVERESQPGYHSTGRSAAMFMESYGPPAVRALTRASRAFYEQPPEGFATTPLMRPRGALYLATHGQEALMEKTRAELSMSCPGLQVLDARAALALAPCLRPEIVHGALYDPDAQDIDVHTLHQGFLRGFRQRGGELRTSATLTQARHDAQGWALQFADGAALLARSVVNAAGAWADELAGLFGAAPIALSWTMDKLGPICRSVADCGIVFGVIHGPDGKDPTVYDRPFDWTPGRGIKGLRIGFLKASFEADHATKAFDAKALDVLKGMGADLIPVALPTDVPVGALGVILNAEAAAAFDEVTRSNRDDQMVQQTRNAWPNSFRRSRFIPAVDYIQANRVRTLLMQKMDDVMQTVDLFVTPSFAASLLQITNLTGHPALVLPNGFNPDGTPVSLSFIGRLFGEAELLAAAGAYQGATDFHLKHPQKFS